MAQTKTFSFGFVYVATAIVYILSILIMLRAATFIHRFNPHINSQLYAITHFITLTVEAVLWFIIARSTVRLKTYALSVINNNDGQALNYVANAMGLGLLYAMLFGIASTFKTLFWQSPYLGRITTITNILPILVLLAASVFLFVGTRMLQRLLAISKPDLPARQYASLLVIFVAAYAGYFYHVAAKISDDDGLRHFTISPLILLFVYVLPYAITWFLGLFSCLYLARYATQVRGTIYKSLFHDLYVGLIIVFVGLYLAQIFYVTNVSSNQFGIGLLFVLSIIALLIWGCLLINSGAKKLNGLEE